MGKKIIIVGASGASGMPLLLRCLELIKEDGTYASCLIMTDSAKLTYRHEMGREPTDAYELADEAAGIDEMGAKPASGSFRTAGMLIVPCSMKTVAGIRCGYTDNLLLRAADVTIKEQRPLVLAARETPLSTIHLRNLYDLSMMGGVRIIPPMLTFYHAPKSIDEMVHHIASRLVEPFGIEPRGFRRWQGI